MKKMQKKNAIFPHLRSSSQFSVSHAIFIIFKRKEKQNIMYAKVISNGKL